MKKLLAAVLVIPAFLGLNACSNNIYQETYNQVQEQAFQMIEDAQKQAAEMNEEYQELYEQKLKEADGDPAKALELMNEEFGIPDDVSAAEETIQKVDWDDMMEEITEEESSAAPTPEPTVKPSANAISKPSVAPTATPTPSAKATSTPKPSKSANSDKIKQYVEEIYADIEEFPGWSKWDVQTTLEFEGLSDEEISAVIEGIDIDWVEQARLYADAVMKNGVKQKREVMIDLLENRGFESNEIDIVISELYD